MTAFNFLQEWYSANCNGDWEHQYGVKINTLDNPGWEVVIDLADTKAENLEIEYKLYQETADDWYGYSIENGVFKAAGDPTKLGMLFKIFKDSVTKHT